MRELPEQQAAKLPVADHRQRARRRASGRREEVQLQQSRPRPKTDLAVGAEAVQVVTREPVPAEDHVGTHVPIHRGHGQRLAQRVAEADVNLVRDEPRRSRVPCHGPGGAPPRPPGQREVPMSVAPPAGGVGVSAASLPVDTAPRADEELTLLSPVIAGPCSLMKLRRCPPQRAAKNASRVGGGHGRRPVVSLRRRQAFRAASEIFPPALAREVQRVGSPAVSLFWRMDAFRYFRSTCPGLLTSLRRRSIECSSTRAQASAG